jgi:hypothetical protein
MLMLGFNPELIKKVRRMIQKNQFKSRPPAIAKI